MANCEKTILEIPLSASAPNPSDVVIFTAPDGTSVIRRWGSILNANNPTDPEFAVVLGSNGVSADGSTYQNNIMINRRVRVFRGQQKQSTINVSGFYYAFTPGTGVITFTPALTDGELLQIEIY